MEPQPVQPLNYFRPEVALPRLPGGAKAVAIIGIVLGALEGFSAVIGLVMLVFRSHIPLVRGVIDAEMSTPFLRIWVWSGSLLAVALVAALLVGSITLLQSKEYGRKLLLAYAALSFITRTAGIVINTIWVQPAVQRQVAAQMAKMGRPYYSPGQGFGMACAIVFEVVWLGAIVMVMTRPHVKSYLAAVASGAISA